YRLIDRMLERFPERPAVLALTATATPQVRQDICRILDISEEHAVLTGFERSNLTFSVVQGQDRARFIRDYVQKNGNEAGIIYAATRKTVDAIYDALRKKGVNAAKYHAGMPDWERKDEQDRFLTDEASVMVATNAFGMGIDKSNIR